MGERVSNPRDVPEAQALIRRLCELQHDVVTAIDPNYAHAHDCFCGEGGFWPLRTARDFRNESIAVDFIEKATREALRSDRAKTSVSRRFRIWAALKALSDRTSYETC